MKLEMQGSGQLPSELPDPGRYRAVAERGFSEQVRRLTSVVAIGAPA